jgi:transcriptional regulator
MYVPSSFAETNSAKLHEFMRKHSFATLVSRNNAGLVASHLPLLFVPDAGRMGSLVGHMARANSQWRDVRGEVMAIFAGPHVYVSPSWYEEDGTVPTWNYVAVHAYGTFHLVEDRQPLLEILRKSVATYESGMPKPWTIDETAPYVDQMMRGITGFRIEITTLEGKWKLSQNHSEDRRRRVIKVLAQQPDEDSQAIAAAMKERQSSAHATGHIPLQ